jgi:hypothetical protein
MIPLLNFPKAGSVQSRPIGSKASAYELSTIHSTFQVPPARAQGGRHGWYMWTSQNDVPACRPAEAFKSQCKISTCSLKHICQILNMVSTNRFASPARPKTYQMHNLFPLSPFREQGFTVSFSAYPSTRRFSLGRLLGSVWRRTGRWSCAPTLVSFCSGTLRSTDPAYEDFDLCLPQISHSFGLFIAVLNLSDEILPSFTFFHTSHSFDLLLFLS